MYDEQSIRELLTLAIDDSRAAWSALVPLQLWLLEADACPEGILTAIHKGLQRNVGSPKHETHLLRLLKECWVHLSVAQKRSSLKLLEELDSRVADRLVCFVIADILGHQINDDGAFETLVRLAGRAEEIPRALAAFGLGYANELEDAWARNRARVLLQKLKTDASKKVRGEAEAALRKWR
jgi:hypothetical protein